MADHDNVRGHTCEGLRRHLDAATYGCIPRISEDGTISGCDDTNSVAITHCPFCGVRLAEAPTPTEAR